MSFPLQFFGKNLRSTGVSSLHMIYRINREAPGPGLSFVERSLIIDSIPHQLQVYSDFPFLYYPVLLIVYFQEFVRFIQIIQYWCTIVLSTLITLFISIKFVVMSPLSFLIQQLNPVFFSQSLARDLSVSLFKWGLFLKCKDGTMYEI